MSPAEIPTSRSAVTFDAAGGMRFASTDRDEVRGYVGRMFCEHSLQLVNRRANLDTRIAHLRCGAVTLTEMSYGADVLIDAGQLGNFYLIQLPVAGRAALTLAGRHDSYGPGRGSVQDPEVPLEMYWSADCRKLVARFDRSVFERFAEAYLGRPLRDCVRFANWFETCSPLGAQLVAQLQAAIQCAQWSGSPSPSPLAERQLETALMAALLFLQPHEFSDELSRPTDARDPAPVRRVREFLEAHAHEAVDIVQLVEVGGVPLRTLHHQFRQALGLSPMQLLREIRLDRVRRELLDPGPTTSVTACALAWGFEHLGRFAIAYRQRFGETPRDTLRRRRGFALAG
ncbi:MAG: AraC family transcriptional regulator [Sphingomonadales bacterium]|nr:AraC family transcriptional regulator [Sphingomonadales bacterium]